MKKHDTKNIEIGFETIKEKCKTIGDLRELDKQARELQ